MGIYHSRPYVAVAEQLLDSADVVIRLQEMRCKRMAEGVAGHPFGKFRQSDGLIQRLLDV